MARPSTTHLVADLLVNVAPRYRELQDVVAIQEIIPYRTVIVQDEVSELSAPLSEEFTENRLYVMDGPVQLASIDLAFHSGLGLVNYSYFVMPREWFKRKAIMNAVRIAVFPYVHQHHPDAPLVEQTQGVYLFPDDDSGLTFQVRAHVSTPECVGIGVAIIDSRFV